MTEGLLLGMLFILLIELPDNLELPETLVSVDILRECSPSASVHLTTSALSKLVGPQG